MFELRSLAGNSIVEPFPGCEANREELQIWTQNSEQQVRALQDNGEVLKGQCAQAAQLLRDRINFKQSDDVFDSSESVRVITIITLVYLSCTVVAVSGQTSSVNASTDPFNPDSQSWICNSSTSSWTPGG